MSHVACYNAMINCNHLNIQVRVAHLTETLEVAQGLDTLQGIGLYDLLMLGDY
jgi:hypothetical protein